jgi:glycosyltransferase involved in cell wall biosynthesis
VNILVICHEYPPVGGGAGVGASDIAAELSKKHSVDVITAGYDRLPAREQTGSLTVHRIWTAGRVNVEANKKAGASLAFASFVAGAAAKALLLNRKKHFEVVHSHFCIPAGLSGMIISALTGMPHITTIIEADIFDPRTQCIEPYRNPLIVTAIRKVISAAAGVISISSYVSRAAERFYGIAREITVIYHGLPGAEAPTARQPGNGNGCSIVAIGRLVPRKGYDVLLSAMALIKDKGARLTIIGDGPERGRLEAMSRDLGIAQLVMFAGPVTAAEKERILAGSDVFALATLHEGQGIVFAEAMRYGLPIVTTNEGGQTDFLQNGVNALLVPPGNVRAMAEALSEIIAGKELRERMSEMNREAVKMFAIETVAERYEKIYARAGRMR